MAAGLLNGDLAARADYPDRPIRIMVPFPPSGTSDILARILAQKLQEKWGSSVVVENRPGAAGNVGMDMVAKATPDGYTLVMTNNVVAINVSLYPKIFDIEKDFAPLGLIGSTPMVLAVSKDMPVQSLGDLTALAKSKPGKINYGSCGKGTPQELALDLYQTTVNADFFTVSYRGCAPAVNDLLGGQVQTVVTTTAQMAPQIAAGNVRGLAVTSKKRSVLVPDVPTFRESGLTEYDLEIWLGLMAPAGTPEPILAKIHSAVTKILEEPAMKEKLLRSGVEPLLTSRAEHAKILHDDILKYAALIKKLQAKASASAK
ncbi:MAG: hypothetical protein BGP08_09255 [Rhizobiales bacterium 64-17]|nr:MAG: hypothetical protein BGP08_09255 [Rhizobiales bacterium 64-17]